MGACQPTVWNCRIRAVAVAAVAACVLALTVGFQEEGPLALGMGADATPVVLSCNGFGAAVSSHLTEGEANVIFSPLSAWASLAMAYAGARGGTAEAMAAALHVAPGSADTHEQFGALLATARRGFGEGL